MNQSNTPSTLEVELTHVTFRNDENGWSVVKARDFENNVVTAVGSFASLDPGETYKFTGKWNTHKVFGKQFLVESSEIFIPTTEDAALKYLASDLFPGIGRITAQKIIHTLGCEALEVLTKNPQKIFEVKKLAKKRKLMIEEFFQKRFYNTQILSFLSKHNITPGLAQKVMATWGENTIRFLSDNPYRLMNDFKRIGFIIADQVAATFGIIKDHPLRLKQSIFYLLQKISQSGHCYLTIEQIEDSMKKFLGQGIEDLPGKIKKTLSFLIEEGSVVLYKTSYYSGNVYHQERSCAKYIANLLDARSLLSEKENNYERARIADWFKNFQIQNTGITLTEEQIEAVTQAALSKVFVLTGGPGVGKTTVVNCLLQLFQWLEKKILLTAPTGRAAQRMSEVSQFPAKTIHRLLEWSAAERRFLRDFKNPLEAQAVIVDESSMLDIALAQQLIQAVPEHCQLIFIGDVDQLPSVGAGNVLKDLLDTSEIPSARLTKIFRQASLSQIIKNAHKINKGIMPEFPEEKDCDAFFFPCESPEEIKKMIEQRLLPYIKNCGYNLKEDLQILTAMNKGDLGTVALNNSLQTLLNPLEEHAKAFKRQEFEIRPKDKVIQLVNNYQLGVFNGDIGVVVSTYAEKHDLVINFSGRFVFYTAEDALELGLAYAITIHKSQGSEFPVVIIPMTKQHYIMLQRNLIYTAITRARKLVFFVGEEKALAIAVANNNSKKRQTHLKDFIEEELSLEIM